MRVKTWSEAAPHLISFTAHSTQRTDGNAVHYVNQADITRAECRPKYQLCGVRYTDAAVNCGHCIKGRLKKQNT